ncbi:S8 family peptidase [Neorhizobium sp. NPDC001467]|uniref:S8 family peptidase n=1 Tax=Neorhizobium sp. NPDC001467 TaxID=3390595 RepID=UPI003D0063A1
MAKSTRTRSGILEDGMSGLGMVLRFAPRARGEGVQQLRKSGFHVASSQDFRSAPAIPNDFDGADVQYFERFGIAIVRRDGERLRPMLEDAMPRKMVSSARPERRYRALGGIGQQHGNPPRFDPAAGMDIPLGQDYLIGFRDGVVGTIDHLLRGRDRAVPQLTRSSTFEETANTWGLQVTRVVQSGLSGAGIKVAVLDTGFDDEHQDFVGRAVTKKLFATNSSEEDIHGHGTHCIGTACGPLRPSSGPRYGIAYESEIYAGKVLGDDGFGTDRSIIAGMEWALEQGCHVISMSLGAATRVGDAPSEDYEHIGLVCLDAGTIVIAAAGNESARPGIISPVGSPANASTILAIGAVDRSLSPASFSSGGLNPGQEVDIAAPGVDILSSLPGNNYDRWNGTSMATPHVSGVAALLAQSDPAFRGWALWARLIQLAEPLSFPTRDVGKGLLQFRAGLEA